MSSATWQLHNSATSAHPSAFIFHSMRQILYLSPVTSFYEIIYQLITVILAYIVLNVLVDDTIAIDLNCRGMTFNLNGNILHMHQSINNIPNSTWTAKILIILSCAKTQKSLVRINRDPMHFTWLWDPPFSILAFWSSQLLTSRQR